MNGKLISHTAFFDLIEKQDDGTIGFNPVGMKLATSEDGCLFSAS